MPTPGPSTPDTRTHGKEELEIPRRLMSQREMSTHASSSFAYSSNLAYALNASTIEFDDPCSIDSGAPNDMTSLSSIFSSYNLCSCRDKVRIANGSLSPMSSKGSIFVTLSLSLSYVLHVPDFVTNL